MEWERRSGAQVRERCCSAAGTYGTACRSLCANGNDATTTTMENEDDEPTPKAGTHTHTGQYICNRGGGGGAVGGMGALTQVDWWMRKVHYISEADFRHVSLRYERRTCATPPRERKPKSERKLSLLAEQSAKTVTLQKGKCGSSRC